MEELKTMEIVQYNEKTLLLKGNTKPYKEELKQMRILYNYRLRGWFFPVCRRNEVEEFINRHTGK